jgi:hypothetical protein
VRRGFTAGNGTEGGAMIGELNAFDRTIVADFRQQRKTENALKWAYAGLMAIGLQDRVPKEVMRIIRKTHNKIIPEIHRITKAEREHQKELRDARKKSRGR